MLGQQILFSVNSFLTLSVHTQPLMCSDVRLVWQITIFVVAHVLYTQPFDLAIYRATMYNLDDLQNANLQFCKN